jgi:hypothetical protein
VHLVVYWGICLEQTRQADEVHLVVYPGICLEDTCHDITYQGTKLKCRLLYADLVLYRDTYIERATCIGASVINRGICFEHASSLGALVDITQWLSRTCELTGHICKYTEVFLVHMT